MEVTKSLGELETDLNGTLFIKVTKSLGELETDLTGALFMEVFS